VFDNTIIVLPNRRGSLYLKKHFSELIGKSFFAPEIFSVEDFITKLSGFNIADNISLNFILYDVYKAIEGEKAKSFDDFLSWSNIVINDFNETDLYLAKAETLFSYLNEAKAIEKWNLNREPLSEKEIEYLRFYNSLFQYYIKFNESLTSKSIAYQGMAYKYVAENIDGISKELKSKKIYFAGFNALTTAEEKIIGKLVNSGIAEVMWDADEFYLNNPHHEAGKFLRKYLKEFKNEKFASIENNYKTSSKEIEIVGVPQNVGQAKYCGNLISAIVDNPKTSQSENLENTAVILCDESLLVPVLYSIPESIGKFNVTMGYPMKFSPLNDLIVSLFELQENSAKFSTYSKEGSSVFHYADIIKVISNPYFSSFLKERNYSGNKIINNILSANKVFYKETELVHFIELNDEGINGIFKPWNSDAKTAIKSITALFASFRNVFKGDVFINENEHLFYFVSVIIKAETLLTEYAENLSISSLRKFISQFINTNNIAFSGEPLKGLQVMGMLESRTIDFENIILLSVNEDIIPKGKSHNSFIPFDIRKEFRLPTYEEKEAVFAYHFYRLIQRAKNITIVYNSEPAGLGSGERSRFIAQMMTELPLFNSNIKISEKILSVNINTNISDNLISIKKSETVMESIKKKAISGFSPTSLACILKCPLMFYFKEIARIKEPDEVEETIESNTLGSVIHKVLEDFYKDFEGKNILSIDLENFLNRYEDKTRIAFEDIFHGGDYLSGKNYLIYQVALIFINKFIKTEIKFLKDFEKQNKYLTIKDIERNFTTTLKIGETEVIIKGKFDRVDETSENIRIIDYKTGAVNKSIDLPPFTTFFDNSSPGSAFPEKALQLTIYSWLYNNSNPSEQKIIEACIVPLKSSGSGFSYLSRDRKRYNLSKTDYSEFESELIKFIEENIFNTEIPFTQTDDIKVCGYCSYSSICNR
jgi:CRISPR/Cas system-associated exonuclease Cas4 (RecB family)